MSEKTSMILEPISRIKMSECSLIYSLCQICKDARVFQFSPQIFISVNISVCSEVHLHRRPLYGFSETSTVFVTFS